MTAGILAALALAGWVYLLLGRGMFWRADVRLPRETALPSRWPSVVAIVPARNEAPYIGQAVASLKAQDYAGAFRVVVVDDQSEDDTGAIARAAGAEVVTGAPRPPGWAGKPWAMAQGAQAAGDAAYIWFTDADIVHAPDTLRRLVAKAEAESHDLVSLMVRLDCRSLWDRLLIPTFVFFFQMLYPFAWVNDPKRRTAGAAGGSMLVRATALARAGGVAAIGSALIDDCALAKAVKSSGGRIWLGLSEVDTSIRPYGGLGGIWRMVARSAYDQLGYSPLALAGTIAGLALLYLAPPVLAVSGMALGALAWLLMALAEAPTLRLYRLPLIWGVFLPVAALLYVGMTLDSAVRHWRGRGGEWKGRTHRTVADRA
jgi:hopene-associated glycosyltransferase HpnB